MKEKDEMFLNEEPSSEESPAPVINFLSELGKDDLIGEIITGLTSTYKSISSKYFYDEAGSKLFEEITRLPEYYLTRTEKSILKKVAFNISIDLKDTDIIELGSGDCSKISILLSSVPGKNIESIRYIPVDVSQAAIEESANILLNDFSGLEVQGVVADFTRQLQVIPSGSKRLFCFFGSTIGNLDKEQAEQFICDLSALMHSGDRLLLGVDMVKSKDLLENAYNDSRGVTMNFNRNILNVVNSLIASNFEPNDFEHVAFYNAEYSRIEMHLKASKDLKVSSPLLDEKIIMEQGETIHTENSHKYTDGLVDELASASGLEIKNRFTDENGWFSVIQFYKTGKDIP